MRHREAKDAVGAIGRSQPRTAGLAAVSTHGEPDLNPAWRHRLRISLFTALLSLLPGASLTLAAAAEAEPDARWQANYEARASFFAASVGPLPEQIQKMVTLTGVWPGGGFFVIPAAHLASASSLYTTFGLSNPDMPAKTRLRESPAKAEQDTLEPQPPAAAEPDVAGYGYELAVLAHPDEKWPIGFLQWAVDAEIVNDVGLLRQVEAKGGLTIENVRIGAARPLHVVITKARPPLPPGGDLPAGRMTLLIATAITSEEARWSIDHGSSALLEKLVEAGVGQRSSLDRASVVR